MKKTFKKFLNELKSNKSYLQYIIVFLSFAFIMTSYEDDLKCLFDEMVMPILSEFRANAFSFVLVCILVFVVASDIKRKWSYRYGFDGRWTFVLFCILFVTLRYRFTGLYNYVPWLWLVSYVDICIVAGLSYLIVAITNKIRINANKQDSLYTPSDGTIVVAISGKSYDNLEDKEENPISDDPEYILAYELAGHAEPNMNKTDDDSVGNAVEIENTIRRETYKEERKEEPWHVW